MSVPAEEKNKALLKTEYAPAERTDHETLIRQHQLWKREQHTRLITEAVPNVILVLNRTRQIVYANSRIALFGDFDTPEKYLGLRVGELLNCRHVEKSANGCGTTSFCEHCGAVNSILGGLLGKAGSEECVISRSKEVPPFQLRVMSTPVILENENFVIFAIEDIHNEKENKRLLEEVQRLATIDPLTGIPNRRSFIEHAEREFKKAKRYQTPVTVIMFDADRLKDVNDNYGHQAGDALLKAIASGIRENLRDIDLFARYGGDEFIVLLPETNLVHGKEVALRIITAISIESLHFVDNIIHPSVTAGVAEYLESDQALDNLIAHADADLISKKREKLPGSR